MILWLFEKELVCSGFIREINIPWIIPQNIIKLCEDFVDDDNCLDYEINIGESIEFTVINQAKFKFYAKSMFNQNIVQYGLKMLNKTIKTFYLRFDLFMKNPYKKMELATYFNEDHENYMITDYCPNKSCVFGIVIHYGL